MSFLTIMPRLVLLLILSIVFHSSVAAETPKISLINVSDEPIHLVGHDVTVAPYQETEITANLGDSLSYQYQDTETSLDVEEENQVFLIGPESVQVHCTTTEGSLDITVKPAWSPRGAARFLNLIYIGYYNGCALNRVVKQFLTQFGISSDYEKRTSWRSQTILDDSPSSKISFQPGYMSFAGSGPNSRTTEVFVVMPDTPQHQLEYFGVNPWETPFGFVKDLTTVNKWEASYGDMEPWGNGPNPQLIYQENGYEYLKEHFPKLTYLKECKIVKERDSSEEKEEEL